MSDFGDFTDDDAWAEEGPDPEQVAKKLHELRLVRNRETARWDALSPEERAVLIGIFVHLIEWLRRQGALVH